MDRNSQISQCQTPKLHYVAAQTKAKKNMKKGWRQVFCTVCLRWKWQDELCEIAKTKPYMEIRK